MQSLKSFSRNNISIMQNLKELIKKALNLELDYDQLMDLNLIPENELEKIILEDLSDALIHMPGYFLKKG